MNRDEVFRLAGKCGANQIDEKSVMLPEDLQRFAHLVAQREREEAAKICEGRIGGAVQSNAWWSGFKEAMRQCAAAIRQRGKPVEQKPAQE